jgi:hypothetical protein
MELYNLYAMLGIISAILLVLSMSRGVVTLLLPVIIAQNKAQGKRGSFSQSILVTLTKSHGLFGILALLFAIAHGALMFITNEMPSLTGGSLIVLLFVQGGLGVLQSRRIGNVKLWSRLHSTLPYVLLVLLLSHILLNSFAGL